MDVIFTSCATESNNAAIAAAVRATGVPPVNGQSQTRAGRPWHAKRHIVTSQVEHSAVLNYCMALERQEAPLLIQEGRPSVDGRGGYRRTQFSTTPAQGASPSSSEEGSRVSARVVKKLPSWVRRGQGVVRTASPTCRLTARACWVFDLVQLTTDD